MLHSLIIKVDVRRAGNEYMAAIGKSIKSLYKNGEKRVDDPIKGREEHLDRIERESVKTMKTAALLRDKPCDKSYCSWHRSCANI